MQKDLARGESIAERLILFVCFLCGGMLIFLLGGNTFNLFPTNDNPL